MQCNATVTLPCSPQHNGAQARSQRRCRDSDRWAWVNAVASGHGPCPTAPPSATARQPASRVEPLGDAQWQPEARAFWGHKWAPNWLFGAAVALQLKRWAGGLGLTGRKPTPPRHMHALAALLKPWGCRGAQQCLTPKGGGGDTCPRCANDARLLCRNNRAAIARALVSSHS